jgi:protein-L-isoaspartate(D-aspartate) O-methyltransferase
MSKDDLFLMVQNQIISRKIGDEKIHRAFLEVERANFVRDEDKKFAYQDSPLSIGFGQTISQPAMVAEMLYEAKIEEGQKVLEVGSGSGYLLALLHRLKAIPYGVERIKELAEKIEKNLAKEGIMVIKVKIGDGYFGWKEYSPFDRIIVSAATPKIPEPLIDQLKIGGILVAPVGLESVQYLTVLKKDKDEIKIEKKTPCVFVPLITEAD